MNEEKLYRILDSLKQQVESLRERLARLEASGATAYADDSDREDVHKLKNTYCEECCCGLCGGCAYAEMV